MLQRLSGLSILSKFRQDFQNEPTKVGNLNASGLGNQEPVLASCAALARLALLVVVALEP